MVIAKLEVRFQNISLYCLGSCLFLFANFVICVRDQEHTVIVSNLARHPHCTVLFLANKSSSQ